MLQGLGGRTSAIKSSVGSGLCLHPQLTHGPPADHPKTREELGGGPSAAAAAGQTWLCTALSPHSPRAGRTSPISQKRRLRLGDTTAWLKAHPESGSWQMAPSPGLSVHIRGMGPRISWPPTSTSARGYSWHSREPAPSSLVRAIKGGEALIQSHPARARSSLKTRSLCGQPQTTGKIGRAHV